MALLATALTLLATWGSGSLDDARQRSIEKLLEEEETKIRAGQTRG